MFWMINSNICCMSVEVLGALFCVYHTDDQSPRGRGRCEEQYREEGILVIILSHP